MNQQFQRMQQKLRYMDYRILIPYLFLVSAGVILVYSASSSILIANGFKANVYGIRQFEYVLLAVIFFGIPTFFINLKVFKNKRFIILAMGISILLLFYLVVLKFVKGSSAEVNGAAGWINLGFINIQPVEIAKLALVLYLAYMLDRRDGKFVPGHIISNFKYPFIISLIVMFLDVVEPDFGGFAILGMIVLVMFSMAGINPKYVITGVILLVIIAGSGALILFKLNPSFLQHSYQLQRFLAFMHPFQLERSSGAQLVNSYYAIHNGGLFGTGLGNSIEKTGYLPEPYTDFILSVASEEIGSLGAIVILGLLFYLMWQIMEVGVHATSQFNSLVCYGVMTMIFTETLFNVGAVTGLLPITGVTLPFISYGGSSLIVLTAGLGIVLNISANEKRKQEEAVIVR